MGPQSLVQRIFGTMQVRVFPAKGLWDSEAGVSNDNLNKTAIVAWVHHLRGHDASERVLAVLNHVSEKLHEHVFQGISRLDQRLTWYQEANDGSGKSLIAFPASKTGPRRMRS